MVVKFNGENKDIGVDDQLPILNYAFIKAHPLNIYTKHCLDIFPVASVQSLRRFPVR